MHIADSFVVKAPREHVWRLIRDPAVLVPCIPGCKEISEVTPTLYKAAIGFSVGPISASFNVEVEVVSEQPPQEVVTRTRGEEGTRASTVSADSRLLLDATAGGETIVHYSSDVTISGRLGKYGLGMMKKKAESLGRQFADSFRAKAEAAEAA
jgi:uncharacterized protein